MRIKRNNPYTAATVEPPRVGTQSEWLSYLDPCMEGIKTFENITLLCLIRNMLSRINANQNHICDTTWLLLEWLG